MAASLVDSHCHLDFEGLAERLPEVIEQADAAGVRLMVTISTRVRQFDRVLAIAEAHQQVYCSVGTHPHNAGEETDVTAEHLVRLARHPKVIGIGEAGLDYHYDFSPREAQAASFRVHCEAARETGLPLIVHSREAEDDTAAIIGQALILGSAPCSISQRAISMFPLRATYASALSPQSFLRHAGRTLAAADRACDPLLCRGRCRAAFGDDGCRRHSLVHHRAGVLRARHRSAKRDRDEQPRIPSGD